MAQDPTEFHDKIRAALAQLDPTDNDHWTDDGLPKTGVVQRIASDQTIKRSDIQAASPGFERPAPTDQPPVDDFGQAVDQTAQAGTETAGGPKAEAAKPTDGDETLEGNEGEFMSEEEVHSILVQRVAACENDIQAADKALADAQNARIAAVKARDAARKDLNAKFPPMTDAEMRKQHIASENARRAAMVEGRGAMASRVDQAMARGNSRGWRRPVRGVVGADGNLIKTPDGRVAIPQPMRTRPQTAQRA